MATNENTFPVSVIGLGNMGLAIAAAYLKAGYQTTVWNRSKGKGERLAAEGATVADTHAEALAASSVVVICLSTYHVVHKLLEPLAGELAGKVLINLTSGTPEEARRTAAWAAKHNIAYLDGAIMAIPPMIGAPEALIFYGGAKAVFDTYEPMLKVLGGSTTYLSSDSGVPLLYDLALLTMMYGAWHGHIHAHAMLKTGGISAAEFLPYADSWLRYLISPLLTDPNGAKALDDENYTTDVSNMNTNKLALDHIIRTSAEMGINADWLTPIYTLAAQKVEEGYGADAFTRIIEGMTSKK